MINNIPIYDAIIVRDVDGMFGLSLVNDPAVESNFVAFSKEKEMMMFSVENEEKRMVTGVVMRCEYPIIRKNAEGQLYYIKFSAKTIEDMAQRLFSMGLQNNIDLQHNFNYIEGVEMVEAFIKDTTKGISPKGFEDIADGSLFATYKIMDDDIWNAIKEGTFKGFSLEGNFSFIPSTDNKEVKNIRTKMSKLFKTIKRAFVAFAEVKTDKGVLSYAGEEDLKVGDEVFVENEDGEAVAAADGEYTAEDGTIIVVAEGKVAEIKEKEVEEEPKAEETVEAEEEEPTDEPKEDEPKTDELDALRAEIEALKADVETLKKTLAELVEKPAAAPVEEEFEKTKIVDAKQSKAERLASYLK